MKTFIQIPMFLFVIAGTFGAFYSLDAAACSCRSTCIERECAWVVINGIQTGIATKIEKIYDGYGANELDKPPYEGVYAGENCSLTSIGNLANGCDDGEPPFWSGDPRQLTGPCQI